MPSPAGEGLHVSRFRIRIPDTDIKKILLHRSFCYIPNSGFFFIFYNNFFFLTRRTIHIYIHNILVRPGFCKLLFLLRPMILLVTKVMQIFWF